MAAVTEMDVALSPEAPEVTEMDLALSPEVAAAVAEGQVVAAGKEAEATHAVTESESSMLEEEEEEEEAGRKRKRDTVDVGDDDIMDVADDVEGRGGDDGAEDGEGGGGDEVEEEAVLPVVPVPQAPMQVEPPPQESPLQRLVDECRVLLDGANKYSPPPSPLTVSRIVALFNGISPDGIRLDRDFDISEVTRAAAFLNPMPVIGGKYIYDCKDFTVAIFYLPAGTVMPLHDHPGMTVFSKLIAGTAHVQSFDWVTPAVYGPGVHSKTRLAKKVLDHDVSAEDGGTWVLYPSTGGNLHRFIAARDEPCAFLDVLTPPYSTGHHRQCTFYKDYVFDRHRNHSYGHKLSKRKKRGLVWMRPVCADVPRDVRIIPMTYNGPPVV